MEQEIKALIEKHYKHVKVHQVAVDNDQVVALIIEGAKYAFVAKRILDKYPQIEWVRFEGGWDTWIYSRQTLKWAGYYGVSKDKKEVVTIRKASEKSTKEVLDAIK